MAYADAAYYENTYKGTDIPETELPGLLERASEDIDAMTFRRIGGTEGLSTLTPFRQEQVRKAVCAQADYRHDYGDMIDAGLAGYHVGDVTVSAGSAGIGQYSPAARRLLLPTGLLNRGVPG